MSKSGVSPEAVFFSLQKTNQNKKKAITPSTPIVEPIDVVEEPAPEEKPARATAARPSKKRGRKPSSEKERNVPISCKITSESKYEMTLVINELKYRGIKDVYNLTDFINEAIEEKLKRTKKQLDME